MRPLARFVSCAVVAVALACAPTRFASRSGSPGAGPTGLRFWTAQAGLSNGARVVAYQIRDVRFTDVAVSFDAGLSDDPPGKEGLAAVAAAVTGAVTGRGGASIDERHFALGSFTNQQTSNEFVEFTARVPPDRLADALAIEADRLAAAGDAIDDATITALRDRYAAWLEHGPVGRTPELQTVVAVALAGTRYGRTAPTPASVRAITPDDVRAFLRARFTPDRAVVVVTGPTPTVEVARAVATAFGATLVPPARVTPAPELPLSARPSSPAAVTTIRMRADAPRLYLAWRIPGRAHDALAGLFADAAQRAAASAISNGIRRVSVVPLVQRAAGLVVLSVDLTDAKYAEEVRSGLAPWVEGAVEAMLRPQAHAQFDFFELERSGVAGVAEWLRATGDENVIAGYARSVDADFGPGLARVARETFAASRAIAVAIDPTGGAAARAPLDFGDDPERPWRLVPNRLAAAAPGASEVPRLVRPPGLDRAERRRLANGLEVVVLPHGTFPFVRASLVFPQDGVPSLRNRSVAQAALRAARNPRACPAPTLTEHGDAVEVSGRAYASAVGALVRGMACATGLRIGDVDLKVARASLEKELGHPAFDGIAAVDRALFPGEPAAAKAAALVGGVTDEEVRAWFARTLRPDRATLVLAGDLVPDERLWKAVDDAFGGWSAGSEPVAAAARADAFPSRRTAVLFDMPGSEALALVRIAAPAIPARDRVAFATLAEHLRDRLERSVVPRLGTVGIGIVEGRDGAALSIQLTVDGALLAGALRTALDELDQAARGGVSPTAIDYARWSTARELAFSFATVEQVSEALGRLAVHGLPPDEWERLGPDLAAVTPARVEQAARALAVGREAILLYGDASKLAGPLRALGLELEVVTAPAKAAPQP